MYSVYQITNNITGKIYIGSSVRVKQRWREHISSSKNPNSPSYEYPLQRAMRKYGIENFTFEVIYDDFSSPEEMQQYEHNMIISTGAYGEKGYNQTTATTSSDLLKDHIQKVSHKCAKVDSEGNILQIYPSYQEAARSNNLEDRASQLRMVCKGEISSIKELLFRDLDTNGNIVQVNYKPYKGRKPVIGISIENPEECKYFESISQAANILGTDRWSITQCIEGSTRYSVVKGYIFRELTPDGEIIENEINIDERIEDYNAKNPIIHGERKSLSEWLQAYDLSRSSYYKRIKNGMSVIEAITAPKKR